MKVGALRPTTFMNEHTVKLRKMASAKITKGKAEEVRTVHSELLEFMGTVGPVSKAQEALEDFEEAYTELEYSLDSLETACDDLESAEDKDERDDAAEQIAELLEESASALEQLLQASIPDPEGCHHFDQSLLNFLREIMARHQDSGEQLNINVEVKGWIGGAPDPEVRRGREAAAIRFSQSLEKRKSE